MSTKYALMVCCLLVGTLPVYAQSVRSLVNGGNEKYSGKNYAEAEVDYRKALEKDVTTVPGHFNLGNSLYKQDKYDESIKSFEDAVQKSETESAKAKAYYNLGDAYVKSEKYQEAVKAFTESLKLNPTDFDAKYNLSYALNKLRDQQQQQNQKNDKNQDKNKDKKDQNKQDQQNQDKNKQDQDKKDQDKQDQDQQQQNRQQQQPQQQERQMSKADAERILEVLKNNEKEVQKKLRPRAASRPKTEKDW